MFDIVVVGGGPVGLHTAKLCEDMGYRVVILEEHREIGKPLKCSGLISRNIEKFFPDIEEWGVVENCINSAVLHSRRSELVLKKRKAAYVINRTEFDRKLSEFVRSEIRLNCRVTGVERGERFVKLRTNRGYMKCEMVCGCDGPYSVVGEFSGGKELVRGVMGLTKEKDFSDAVELHFDTDILKDGFFWKIPRGERTEYGAWGSMVKFSDIENFFRVKLSERFGGLIPVRPAKKTYTDRTILAGASAGQVKPWSGGGVVYGILCSKIAAKVIEKAFRANDFSESVLEEYERVWKKSIGKQIKAGLVFRKFLRHSKNFQLDILFKAGSFFDYGRLDMDFIL